MLSNVRKSMTFEGESRVTVNGKEVRVESFTARISGPEANDVMFSTMTDDRTAYFEHKAEVREDRAEFEDAAYAFQEEFYAEESKEEE